MFHLVKWLVLGMVGYLIFEIVFGVEAHSARQLQTRTAPAPLPDVNEATHPVSQGLSVAVSDGSGAARTTKVGRGVIS